MDERVGIVGSGVAVDAIEAALSDAGVALRAIEPAAADDVDRTIVVGPVGARAFERVNEIATRWVSIEIGGAGGRSIPDLDATIALFGPDGGCFQCLSARVGSHLNAEDDRGDSQDSSAEVPPRRQRLAGALAGNQLVAWLESEVESGAVLEVPYASRHLHPVPGCPCGDGRDRSLDRTEAPVGLDATVARAESTVDPCIGLLGEVGEVESFPAPYYLAELGDTRSFSDARAGPHAAGVAADWNAAYVKAVGEALERYAAGVYRQSAATTAPATDVDNPVSPEAFVLPEDGYEAPDPERPIPWVPGEDLRDGSQVHLPLEFVQYPPPESRHKPAITTGLGLSTEGTGALLSGLYEVLERDATMLAWYSTFEPIELAVEDDRFETLRRRARAEELSVTALLLTQDVDVPVVGVAVHRDETWPKFAVGAAADLRPADAAVNALGEALQNWMELRGMGPEQASEESTAIGRYADLPRAARSFVETDATVAADSVGPDAPPDGRAEFDAVLDRIAAADLEAYATRLTTRDVEAAGFETVRVLVPEAQPLFTGERYFGERARTVPRQLGYRPRLDRPPHPYP